MVSAIFGQHCLFSASHVAPNFLRISLRVISYARALIVALINLPPPPPAPAPAPAIAEFGAPVHHHSFSVPFR
ncbi:hypothetical protein EJB05_04610 [Eragrostis curvula]|uniref:Uncharacterized protein n=1 Tax=Eragrostis curvula TaxID=38414 RepID=A0A5J9WB62_9POAL|nr:hypothetical protein EJB05_04610 [Eragrostis curvula]